jgi:hypothetical protein
MAGEMTKSVQLNIESIAAETLVRDQLGRLVTPRRVTL